MFTPTFFNTSKQGKSLFAHAFNKSAPIFRACVLNTGSFDIVVF